MDGIPEQMDPASLGVQPSGEILLVGFQVMGKNS